MTTTRQLGNWLAREIAREIWGREPQRAPRRRQRRGPARNYRYRGWIRSLPSAVSGEAGCDACHTGRFHGMGQKASDYTCIPLTREEHLEYHARGRQEFEARHDLDIQVLVRRLNRCWANQHRLIDQEEAPF
jgi:hypothetical protein